MRPEGLFDFVLTVSGELNFVSAAPFLCDFREKKKGFVIALKMLIYLRCWCS